MALDLTNVRLQEELQLLAIQDPLTGLYNRRYMQEYLENETARAARHQGSIGLTFLDIGHFKKLNDQYGHDAGDKVLEKLAATLQSQIREGDICCSYGGEEFLLILPGSSYQATMERAEKLRLLVSKTQFRSGEMNLGSVTISLGVSAYPTHEDNSEPLIRAAEQAMYEAKVKGKNLVQGQKF
jgi:diguanylate cyclase (GGDEF)-like protein